MKKIIRIFFITLGALLILLITLPILFKGKIEAIVKTEINKSVTAQVDWDRFSLNLFRGFPDLSINLHNMSVVGIDTFAGDTLVALKRFEFRANPFSAIKKNLEVKAVVLNRPLINGIVLEDGTANYDIVPPSEQAPEKDVTEEPMEKEESVDEAGEPSSMGASLKRFAIENGRIFYKDAVMGVDAAIEDLNLELAGDFSMAETELTLGIYLEGIQAKYGGIRYMKDGSFGLDLKADADMVQSKYTLKENEIRINGLVLGAQGTVEMPDDGSIITDLTFGTKETSFKTLLSMVPAIYLSDFESLKTSGSLELDGTVKGTLKDSIYPDATLQLKVKDGFFSYPDLPKDVSDVQIALLVDFKGSNMDATSVNLDRFHLLLGGNPFEIKLRADHPFSDLHVAGLVKGNIDFATLKDIVPMEDLDLDGMLETDLEWDTRLSYIEQEKYEDVNLDGLVAISGVHVEAPDIPVPVEMQKLSLVFTPKYVNLETLDLLLGSSDLHLDGKLTNFIPYVFDNQTVAGTLNVTSRLLNANEFMPETDTTKVETTVPETESTEENGSPVPPDSLAVPSQLKIPQNIDFLLSLDLKKLVYDNIVVENLTGNAKVKDGVASLENLKLDILKGSVIVDGTVDTRPEFTEADVDLQLLGIDIPTSYETFVTVEKLAPMAKQAKGNANIQMDLFTKLDAGFNPLYESIFANGHVFTRALKLEQPAAMDQLSSLLKSDKFKNLELDKADFFFTIEDGRVKVKPFDVNYQRSKINVSGSHGIDQTMNYVLDMVIDKKDLGSGVNELMSGLNTLASGAGFSVPQSEYLKVIANITGTFKDPKVHTDLSGNYTDTKTAVKEAVKEKVTEKVTEEVEKVEEQVREEAGAKADEMIKAAEAEKAKLVNEAVTAGEKLKKEAKTRGDQLIKEAGNNPLKQVAAKKTAEELMKQAEKQSDNLVKEAEQKGDAIIAKAKTEAEKI